jgi:hypothetical protein
MRVLPSIFAFAKRNFPRSIAATLVLGSATTLYVLTHPLVFNESFLGHAHCMVGAGLALDLYASEHGGRFPSHTNGYGDALLLLDPGWDSALTGPGYTADVITRARQSGENAPESEFGRVYIQGLSKTNAPDIAIFYDKLPTPGGDHCNLWHRLSAPLSREVWTIGGQREVIREVEWPTYSKRQIELLVAARMSRSEAEAWYRQETNR